MHATIRFKFDGSFLLMSSQWIPLILKPIHQTSA